MAPFTLPSPTRPAGSPHPLIPARAAPPSAIADGTPVLRNLQPAARCRRPHRASWRQRRPAKSTFAKMVAGALPLQAGEIEARAAHPRRLVSSASRSRRSIRTTRRWTFCAARRPDDSRSSRRSRLAQFGLSFDEAGDHRRQSVGRRARAASSQSRGNGGAASVDPGRADQPSRHRQPPLLCSTRSTTMRAPSSWSPTTAR